MSALTELWRLLLQWPLLPPLLLMVRIAMAVELLSTHLQRYPALLDPTQKQEKTNMISQRSPDGQEMRKELRILGADPKANRMNGLLNSRDKRAANRLAAGSSTCCRTTNEYAGVGKHTAASRCIRTAITQSR